MDEDRPMTSRAPDGLLTAEPLDGEIVLRFRDRNVRLDEQATEAFREQVLRLIDLSAPPRLTLDLGNVRFLSSTTLGALVGLRKMLLARGGHLALAPLRPE